MSKSLPQLDALKAGDLAAWNEAFHHLWPMALRAAQHPAACLVAWEAEDVASDAILELIAQIGKVASIEELPALAVTISYRRAISLARRKSAIKRIIPNGDPGAFPNDAASVANCPDHDLLEMTVMLKRALDFLESDTRTFIMEKIVEELTYHEISLRHEVPIGTVCSKVARGLKELRDRLRDSPQLLKELQEYLR